jgi:serine/threonine-protein phosphatase 4 catalytic subunit
MHSLLAELPNTLLAKYRKLIVVGDLHGDYASFRSILNIANPAKDLVIFLGDYADRGISGTEVIEGVSRLFDGNRKNVLLLKGNHEDYTENGEPKFSPWTLISEIESRKEAWRHYFKTKLAPFLKGLCLAAIIPGNLLFVHGGVSNKINTLNDLRCPSENVEEDVLWSDPFEGVGEHPNYKRGGAGVEFGKDVSMKICKRLGVERIIRSHEPQKAVNGPIYSHGGKLATISSTRVYGGNPIVLSFSPSNLLQLNVIWL